MRCRTILALVAVGLATAFGARAGESLSPEELLSPALEKDAYWPSAAWGKETFLVVWQSGRDVPGGNGGDIVGCRVDKSGRVLDAKPLVIAAAKDEQEQPQAAFGAGVFLVVWQDLRNLKDYDVYAARVTPEGKVLDPDGILISGGARNQCVPRVVFDGKGFLVVWADMRSGTSYEVWGTRLTPDGKVQDAQGFTVAAGSKNGTPGHRWGPSVAAAGEGASLVFWLADGGAWEFRGVKDGIQSGSHFVRDGKAVEAGVIRIPSSYYPVAGGSSPTVLARGAKGYLLTYRNFRPAGRSSHSTKSSALMLDAAGKPNGEPFNLLDEANVMESGAAWDGSAYVAACARMSGTGEAVMAGRLGDEGKPLGEKFRVSGNFVSPAARPCVASDGAGTTLIAYEKHPAKSDVPIKVGFRLLTLRDKAPGTVTSLVTNPGFETPAVADFQGTPAGATWKFSGGSGIANKNGNTWGKPAAPEGAQVAFVQNAGQFSQETDGFKAGVRYRVVFAAAKRNYGGVNDIEVFLDDTSLGTFGPDNTTFEDFTTDTVVPRGSKHTLKFVGLGIKGDNTAFIDNVRIVALDDGKAP